MQRSRLKSVPVGKSVIFFGFKNVVSSVSDCLKLAAAKYFVKVRDLGNYFSWFFMVLGSVETDSRGELFVLHFCGEFRIILSVRISVGYTHNELRVPLNLWNSRWLEKQQSSEELINPCSVK